MPTARRARIFMRWRLVFLKLPKIAKSFAKLLEEYFKHFCQKSKMTTQFDKLLEMLLPIKKQTGSLHNCICRGGTVAGSRLT